MENPTRRQGWKTHTKKKGRQKKRKPEEKRRNGDIMERNPRAAGRGGGSGCACVFLSVGCVGAVAVCARVYVCVCVSLWLSFLLPLTFMDRGIQIDIQTEAHTERQIYRQTEQKRQGERYKRKKHLINCHKGDRIWGVGGRGSGRAGGVELGPCGWAFCVPVGAVLGVCSRLCVFFCGTSLLLAEKWSLWNLSGGKLVKKYAMGGKHPPQI